MRYQTDALQIKKAHEALSYHRVCLDSKVVKYGTQPLRTESV